MITKTMQGYPYNRIHSDSPLQLRLSEALVDILPHGSGINGSWIIDNPKTIENRFYAHNCFMAMNENGYYCHNYDFTLTIDFIPGSDRQVKCQYCEGRGYRFVFDIHKVHPVEMSGVEIVEFIEQRFSPVYKLDGRAVFNCNICNGKGYMVRHPFELIRLNFHGAKENMCCGYELKDYIYEIVDSALCELKGESI